MNNHKNKHEIKNKIERGREKVVEMQTWAKEVQHAYDWQPQK